MPDNIRRNTKKKGSAGHVGLALGMLGGIAPRSGQIGASTYSAGYRRKQDTYVGSNPMNDAI